MKTTIIIITLILLLVACSGNGLPDIANDALDGTISKTSRYNNPGYDVVSVFEVSDTLWCVVTTRIESTHLREDNSGFYILVNHFVIRQQDHLWLAHPIYADMGDGITGQSVFENLGCDNWATDED